MERRVTPALAALLDAAAILLFVSIGLVSHHRGLAPGGYARDALPLLAGWFGAALLFHPYAKAQFRRLLATWAVGVPAGVLMRALVLDRALNGKEAAFLGVALVTIGLFVAALRVVATMARSVRQGRRPAA